MRSCLTSLALLGHSSSISMSSLSSFFRSALRARHGSWPCQVSGSRFSTKATRLPPDFTFFPNFFTVEEQCVLLKASLKKLDSMESGKFRRKRREFLRSHSSQPSADPVQALFLPDEYYDFQEACLDFHRGLILVSLTYYGCHRDILTAS